MSTRRQLMWLSIAVGAVGLGVAAWQFIADQTPAERAKRARQTQSADRKSTVSPDSTAPTPDAGRSETGLYFRRPDGKPAGAVDAIVGVAGSYPPTKTRVGGGDALALASATVDILRHSPVDHVELLARTDASDAAIWDDVGVDGAVDARKTIELGPANAVDVTVVDADNQAVSGANVRLSRGLVGLVQLTKTTDVDGHASFEAIPAGDYRLGVDAPGRVRRSRHLLHTNRADQVRMQLDRGAIVAGQVVDPSGAPVSQAQIQVIPVSPFAGHSTADEIIDADLLSQVGLVSQTAVAGSDGHFSVDGVAAGAVRIRADAAGYHAGLSETLRCGSGGVERAGRIVLEPTANRRDLLVRLHLSQPQPAVADAELIVDDADPARRCRGRRIKAGDWRFPNCGTGPRTLVATSTAGDTLRWKGHFDETTEITLTAPRAVKVYVSDEAGAPVAGALVQLWRGATKVFEGSSRSDKPLEIRVGGHMEATVVAFDSRRGAASAAPPHGHKAQPDTIILVLDEPLLHPIFPPGHVRDIEQVEQMLGVQMVGDGPSWLVDALPASSRAARAGVERGDRLVYLRRTGGADELVVARDGARHSMTLPVASK